MRCIDYVPYCLEECQGEIEKRRLIKMNEQFRPCYLKKRCASEKLNSFGVTNLINYYKQEYKKKQQ